MNGKKTFVVLLFASIALSIPSIAMLNGAVEDMEEGDYNKIENGVIDYLTSVWRHTYVQPHTPYFHNFHAFKYDAQTKEWILELVSGPRILDRTIRKDNVHAQISPDTLAQCSFSSPDPRDLVIMREEMIDTISGTMEAALKTCLNNIEKQLRPTLPTPSIPDAEFTNLIHGKNLTNLLNFWCADAWCSGNFQHDFEWAGYNEASKMWHLQIRSGERFLTEDSKWAQISLPNLAMKSVDNLSSQCLFSFPNPMDVFKTKLFENDVLNSSISDQLSKQIIGCIKTIEGIFTRRIILPQMEPLFLKPTIASKAELKIIHF